MKPARSILSLTSLFLVTLTTTAFSPPATGAAGGRNIVFVLIDDMRYDAMSAMKHPFLQTPALDRLTAEGVHFRNAFVTTSLCSPSRASFLTGIYAHRHQVLNNSTRLDPALPTFPRLLKQSEYETAFIGKWHMGSDTDEPRPGFDHWASFRGQGVWDTNELYDLQEDPRELHNRISTSRRKKVTVDPGYETAYGDLQKDLRRLTAEHGALDLPSWRRN